MPTYVVKCPTCGVVSEIQTSLEDHALGMRPFCQDTQAHLDNGAKINDCIMEFQPTAANFTVRGGTPRFHK